MSINRVKLICLISILYPLLTPKTAFRLSPVQLLPASDHHRIEVIIQSPSFRRFFVPTLRIMTVKYASSIPRLHFLLPLLSFSIISFTTLYTINSSSLHTTNSSSLPQRSLLITDTHKAAVSEKVNTSIR
jgi:hypothetical protein